MIVDHVKTSPSPPSSRSETTIPREVDELVLACLAKDPNDRPQSMVELLERIDATERAIGTSWTDDAAADWWRLHLPALVLDSPAPATP
jgi:serine/threonine-protein kinase